jgi:hypothetical protein
MLFNKYFHKRFLLLISNQQCDTGGTDLKYSYFKKKNLKLSFFGVIDLDIF